jgi:hypothetical protein
MRLIRCTRNRPRPWLCRNSNRATLSALSHGRSGAGAHIRERGAQRRKDKVALQKALRGLTD